MRVNKYRPGAALQLLAYGPNDSHINCNYRDFLPYVCIYIPCLVAAQ